MSHDTPPVRASTPAEQLACELGALVVYRTEYRQVAIALGATEAEASRRLALAERRLRVRMRAAMRATLGAGR